MSLKRKHSVSDRPLPLTDLSNSEPTMKKKRARHSTASASERLMPDILNASTEFGSPHKFWTSLCEKDEAYYRDPDYMKNYKELEPHMRNTLISWILDVCEDLTLHRESFHLAVDFLDRLFSKGDIDARPRNLQLIGVATLLLATKIEEVYPPKLLELVSLTAGACTLDEVRRMEEIILSKLEWHCSPVTAVQWLAFYLHLISRHELEPFFQPNSSAPSPDSFPSSSGVESMIKTPPILASTLDATTVSDSQYVSQEPTALGLSVELNTSLDQSFIVKNHSQMRHLGQFSLPNLMRDDFIVLAKVTELCIFDMDFLKFTYSQIAAAIVMLSYEPRDQLESITGFRYDDLADAIDFVEPIINATRASVSPGVAIPQFKGIDARDYHNIQTGYGSDYDALLTEIKKAKAERKKLNDSKKKTRAKRLF